MGLIGYPFWYFPHKESAGMRRANLYGKSAMWNIYLRPNLLSSKWMNCGGSGMWRIISMSIIFFQEIQQPTANSKCQITAVLAQIFRVPTENQICQITSGFVENWNWKYQISFIYIEYCNFHQNDRFKWTLNSYRGRYFTMEVLERIHNFDEKNPKVLVLNILKKKILDFCRRTTLMSCILHQPFRWKIFFNKNIRNSKYFYF